MACSSGVSDMVVTNFGAGPGKLPAPVLEQVQAELLDLGGHGMSILEMSHRSEAFGQIVGRAEERIRRMIGGVSDEYAVLWMQGGGTGQFSAVPLNLVGTDKQRRLDYLVTGHWSRQAAKEARHLGYNVHEVELATKDGAGRVQVQPISDLRAALFRNGPPTYVYYCDNETIDGIEMPSSTFVSDQLGLDHRTCLVSDMSSNFLSRPIDMSRFGLVFASAQKNLGPAGVTIVLVERAWIQQDLAVPKMLDYALFHKHSSLYNTPPCFAIYVAELVLAWLEGSWEGGLVEVGEANGRKSRALYGAIADTDGLFANRIPAEFRSRMNVVFHASSPDAEARFLAAAKAEGLEQLKGHRSVGGLRASLYNAVTADEVHTLSAMVRAFK